jgi:hypothetical protein
MDAGCGVKKRIQEFGPFPEKYFRNQDCIKNWDGEGSPPKRAQLNQATRNRRKKENKQKREDRGGASSAF